MVTLEGDTTGSPEIYPEASRRSFTSGSMVNSLDTILSNATVTEEGVMVFTSNSVPLRDWTSRRRSYSLAIITLVTLTFATKSSALMEPIFARSPDIWTVTVSSDSSMTSRFWDWA